jgi:acetyl-CoA C-acetyltransferase
VTLDPRTPVMVGVGTATQRLSDPGTAVEAAALMVAACTAAAADAGSSRLLGSAGAVLVPRGTWRYHDAGRLVAAGVGNTTARTVTAELGVLQTTLVERACARIAAGDLDVALVVGGEAKWRDLRAAITGQPATSTDDSDGDGRGGGGGGEVLRPQSEIVSAEEVAALGGFSAVNHYALIENARRWADRQSIDDHLEAIARLWERFNVVARSNPSAWNPQPMTAGEIRRPGPANKPLAWPYNKWHNSQWNVDQAACLILCSVEAARDHGVSADRWVFPHAIAWSDHAVPVSRRPAIDRSPGFAEAGRAAFALAGAGPDDIAHIDLYSCFPIAVRTQARELGLGLDRQLTETGGMTFAGGPLNNYVLQSTARMMEVLREAPDDLGMVTAISGMITKQAVSIWGCRPPPAGYRAEDVSAAIDPAEVPVVAGAAGQATITTYTVLRDPDRAVVVADLPDDAGRALAVSPDAALAGAMTEAEWCGRPIVLDGEGGFSPS